MAQGSQSKSLNVTVAQVLRDGQRPLAVSTSGLVIAQVMEEQAQITYTCTLATPEADLTVDAPRPFIVGPGPGTVAQAMRDDAEVVEYIALPPPVTGLVCQSVLDEL